MALISCAQVLAQQPSGVVSNDFTNYRFSFIENRYSWVGSLNPAGLLDFKYKSLSIGLVNYNHKNGELKNYFESNNSSEFRVGCKSLYRFNDKVVTLGSISYTNFTGREMSGSVFINPYSRPFDIVDFNSSTEGAKNLELYNLKGAVAVALLRDLDFGASIEFNSANYAKMKDLRYKTSYSKLNASLSLRYSPFSSFFIGAGYSFLQEVEGIVFSFYGVENILYRELVSFGGFWGVSSTYSDISHNFIKNSRQPFIELSHKISAQLSYTILERLTLFMEGYYSKSSGFYGLKNTSSVVHCENENSLYGINSTLLYKLYNTNHKIGFNYSNYAVDNYRTVWRSQNTGSGGTSEVVYFDPLKVGMITQKNYSVNYRGDIAIDNMTPKWQINAKYNLYKRNIFSTIYPYYRSQKLTSTTYTASLLRNIKYFNNIFTVSFGGGYRSGDGLKFSDGTYATPSEDMIAPKSSNEMLQREWDFLTASQYKINPMLRYSYLLDAKTEVYIEANYSYLNAFQLKSMNQHSLIFSIGCNF